MLAIASPALGGSLTSPDAKALPEGAGARVVADVSASEFEGGNPTRLGIVIPPGKAAAAKQATGELSRTEGVVVGRSYELKDGSTYEHLTAAVEPFSDAGQDLLADVRALPWPPGTLVAGRAAELTDQRDSISSRAPLVVAIVVVTNLLLVLLMVRSLLLPLVSIALNALTVLAAYGLMVAAFQNETLAGLLGAAAQDGIDVSVPALAFAVVFGLSTDYGIFLFSRIAEARRDGLGEEQAITAGLSRTGRLITSAAVIFAVAVGANAFSDLVIVKEFAVAVAVAVILDATIVRGLLVPAILKLLGPRAWWPGRQQQEPPQPLSPA
jgi:RND superfamily putative drug exporter